ncbi:sugar transporter [uncultured Tateyamaria sp.]|uniref:sugar transporter n=1 Tax=Tateyamaria sp. 1078 TaxID=3417464 RepID=UPI00262A0771|nr:sugar transporter [uncultured Tateyamaria sp.]
MSDKTASGTKKKTPLFVRPAKGNAIRLLTELDGGGAQAAPQTADTTPAQASPAPAEAEAAAPNAPPVPAARMHGRHWGLILSFGIFVIVPVLLTALYLWQVAEDQYGSTAGFTVRQEERQGASELLGGLAALTGGSAAGDTEILYEFIRSQALVRRVDADLDIRGHYSARWEADPVFALRPGAAIEDLAEYWERIVRVSHDQGAGLLEVRVRAFDRDMAQAIATEIVARSQDMINELNAQAREDAMRFARSDLEEAVARLSAARQALTSFRSRTQIVDPEADIQGRMGVMNNLQQQLAQALIEMDLLSETTSSGDPRLVQADRRIEVIRDRLARERIAVARGEEGAVDGQDYPSLISEFEGLVVEREFAEENYRASLAAMDLARDDVIRQSRYLATYIRPTLAETAEYPQRDVILGLAALFALLSWAVGCLIFYSIRDRG